MTSSSQPAARLRPFRPVPFGRYTLLAPLATGGMGEIYLARMEGAQGFEKLCVIKKILPHLAADVDFVERFVHEARTLVKLSHGAIAQVLDMGLHQGDPYLALEFVDGKDLRKVGARMRDRRLPMPLTFSLHVMARVLDALAYAHRKRDEQDQEIGLVHRDISPQNILISYEGEVKIIDFGLAKSTLSAAKTNPSIILGKFLYMSPEQARHQPVDRRADLYAVGLCLYELLSGKNPNEDASPADLMARVADPEILPLRTVDPLCPAAVEALVSRALMVDPKARFQTAEEFRGRLLGCLLEIDPSAGPETVSRFMRETFEADYHAERRMLTALRESLKSSHDASSRTQVVPIPQEATTVTGEQAATLIEMPAAGVLPPVPEKVEEVEEDAPHRQTDPDLTSPHAPMPERPERSEPKGRPRAKEQAPEAKVSRPRDDLTQPNVVIGPPEIRPGDPVPPAAPAPAPRAPRVLATTPRADGPRERRPAPAHAPKPGDDLLAPLASAYEEERTKELPRTSRERAWRVAAPVLALTAVAIVYILFELLGQAPSPARPPSSQELRVAGAGSPPSPAEVSPPTEPPSGGPASAAAASPSEPPAARPDTSPEEGAGEGPAVAADEDLLVELLTPKPAPARRRPVRASPLKREWQLTHKAFTALEQVEPCDGRSMTLLCARYEGLAEEVRVAMERGQSPKRLLRKVRSFRAAVQRRRQAKQ